MRCRVRRREFIALLGGATAAWPLTVRAQRPESVRRIGALIPGDASGAATRAQAFREGLATLGWTDGDNIQIEYVWATGDVDRLRSDVAKLRALAPEVIVTGGTEVTTAVREVLGSVPIVFVHVL